jgi:ATP-dependent DNA ligase
MLARLARELPEPGFLYEPKWDGFRCLAFCEAELVDLRSRNDRPLARYFPEIVEALRGQLAEPAVLDGELVVAGRDRFDFSALLARLHPAASRVARLRADTPASYIAFDVLARGAEDLRPLPLSERRAALAELLPEAAPPLHVSPATDDAARARRWLAREPGGGIDGVVAKRPEQPYESGARTMIKVKREQTADCVVAGLRLRLDAPAVGSLLLGLYDEDGELHHVGVSSSFSDSRRRELLGELRPYVTTIEGHPWERGFLLAGGPTGRLRGAAARWSAAEMELDWVPLRAELVCEVAYDHVDIDRFRHPARFRRWRPDRDPRSCLLDQVRAGRADPFELLAPT